MKIVAQYLIAVYIGVCFLSLYNYLVDNILHFSPLTMQLQHLISYLVYFILYKTWLFGLILPVYYFMFYKCYGMEKILYKITFIIVLAVCLSSIYLRRDLYFTEPPKGIRLFVVYFLTGLSLLFAHVKYWHKRDNNSSCKSSSVDTL